MNSIVYLVGLVVIVLFVLSFDVSAAQRTVPELAPLSI